MVNELGLLEKADQLKSEKPTAEAPEPLTLTPEAKATEPAAVAPPVKTKKEKRKRGRREKKVKPPREKKVRVAKVLPDGFEEASNGQKSLRKFSDFTISWGWAIPMIGLFAWGAATDLTYVIVLGLLLTIFNVAVMPSQTSRTMGNWVSRTTYVNSKSEVPHFSYIFLKSMTFPLVLFSLIMFFFVPSTGISTSAGKVFLAMGVLSILPPMIDYLFYRMKMDNLGLWDTLYGGVWMVRTKKAAQAKGWLKRLEQLGDYTETQGWWAEKDAEADSEN
ncbi:MAG: hypothetical protein CMA12_02785 [Euryarchaeota archaeon]|nr:hypothetical protein [Euryarchaeota archaeon]OUW22618.1 MAG: hypothetical protein CBD33_01355 [Euryarchaeota archaeon TMED173]